MKNGIAILAAFLGGAVIGGAAGLLLAPEKGEDQRRKIRLTLARHGVKLNKEELNRLVDEIKSIGKSKEEPEEDFDVE